jgi:hypothetical protein
MMGTLGQEKKLHRWILLGALCLIGCQSKKPLCPEFHFMDQCSRTARWEDCEESALVQGLMVPCDGTH